MKLPLLQNCKTGLLFIFATLLTLSVSATVFNVNTTNDTHAVNPAAGTGLDASGNISFRSALEAANAVGGTHTINLSGLTYNLTLGEIVLGDFTQNITINGISANSTIVNMTSTNQDRILFINTTGTNPNITTTINNVQFTNGRLNTDTYGGGAIIAGGPNNSLTLNNCIFSGNSIGTTGSGGGGAVRYNGGGSLTIDNCTFSNNSNSKADGGAVSYFLENLVSAGNGAVNITNSTFNSNSVTAGGGSGGGAIHVAAQGRITVGVTFTVNILRNTFTSNSVSGASGVGGAIRTINSFDAGNTMQVNYNRFANNTSTIAPSALAMSSAQGNVNADDNWWGCNTGPTAAGACDKAAITGSGGAGTLTAASWLQLKLTASASPICHTSGTATVTASFLTNSAGSAISTGNLTRVIGLPITFNSSLGTLSAAQSSIQAAGTATVTFTAGATGGTGTVNGVVDNVPAAETTPARASITINKPIVTNPVTASGTVGSAFSQTFTGSGGSTPYTFSTSSTLPTGLTLSSSGLLSGTPTQPGTFPIVVNISDNISCTGTGSTYNLVIACQTITVTNPVTTTGTVGTAFSQSFTQSSAIGATIFSLNSGTLPTGLSLSTSGVLSGTPTQPGTFPITVTVTDENTCTGTSSTYNLIINCPTITVINPGTTTGTAGTAFSQTFTSAGGAPTVTFATASTLPTGLTLSTAGVLSGTPTQSGTFPIVVVATDANGCTGTGSSYSLVISCAPVTTPTITPGGPTTFCAGGAVTLTSSSATGNQWHLNGSPIGGETNQTYVVTATGNYTVIVTEAGPCPSAPSAIMAITVNPAPATPTIAPGGPTTFCAGGSVTLTSSSASGNQWYINGNPIGGETNQAYVATASGSYTVVVTASGCPSSPSAATVVTVNPIPATPTITPGGPTTFCTGGSVTLTSSSATGNQWYLDANPIGGATNQTYIATASGSYTVVVTASGCPSSPSEATVVTVNPIPTVNAVSNQAVCSGSTVAVAFSGSQPSTTYNWTNTNPAIGLGASGNGDLNFTATNSTAASISGTITVTPALAGCTGSPITFTITVAAQAVITSVTGDQVCATGGTANLSATGNGTINWYDALTGGNLVNTGTTYSPTVASTTTYYVESVTSTTLPQAIAMPAETGPFLGNVRGYWFTAPASFVITSLFIPTDASSADQNIAVVRLNAPPPFYYTTTTNSFTTLFLTQNNTTVGSIPVSILVQAGDVIGVLGSRGTTSSYATAAPIIINGINTPIARLGMQFPLATTAPQDLWTEPSGSISRVVFEYTSPVCISTPRVAVTAEANLLPEVTCPGNITQNNTTGQCGSIVTYTTTATGAPAPAVTYTFTGATTGSGSGDGSGSFFNVGVTTVVVTATNSCGAPTCTFTVTINDTQAPTLTCPGPVTVSCVSAVPPVNIASVTGVSDNCAGIVTVTHISDVISAQTCTNRYTITRTYRATDVASNFTDCTQIITVNDQTPPTLTCPAPVTVSCVSAIPPVNVADVTGVSDNCGGAVIVTHISDVISAQTCANRYIITRTYRATDVCGNFAECTQIITVNDQTAPTLTCPAPVTVSCVGAVPAVNVADVTGVSDNCGGAVIVTHISDVISAQTCANRYIITRTYRATDVCGNFAECTQIITVNDQTAPTLTCPAPATVSCVSEVPAANIADVTGVSDNCGGTVTVTHIGDVISNQTCANRYTITRTYRATDVCGNFAECTQIITVNDQTAPTLTCPAPVTVSCAGEVPAANIADVTGVSDNCAGTVIVTYIGDVISNQTCPNRYTITRTYRATDVCGNFTDCTQIITVDDQTAPVITCPANITVTAVLGTCTRAVTFDPVATDNCGAVTIVSVPASGSLFSVGVTTVTSTATDACGNTVSCTFTVTVLDPQIPVITTEPVNNRVCEAGTATFTVVSTNTVNYQWQHLVGASWLNVSNSTTATLNLAGVTFGMNGTRYRVIANGLCTKDTSVEVTLTVDRMPVVTLAATPTTSLLPGQTTTLNATANLTGGTYAWFFNGNPVPAATGASYGPLNVNNLGMYRVTYALNTCTATSNNIELTAKVSDQLWVYPNPNAGQFQVRFYNQPSEIYTVSVYDVLRQKVYEKQVAAGNTPYSQIDVNLGFKAAGIYTVILTNRFGTRIGYRQILVRP